MRDPERITAILEKLESAWRANPDLRLSQLILNSCPASIDPFFVEDDVLNFAGTARVDPNEFGSMTDEEIREVRIDGLDNDIIELLNDELLKRGFSPKLCESFAMKLILVSYKDRTNVDQQIRDRDGRFNPRRHRVFTKAFMRCLSAVPPADLRELVYWAMMSGVIPNTSSSIY
jgi:hypothetical protein